MGKKLVKLDDMMMRAIDKLAFMENVLMTADSELSKEGESGLVFLLGEIGRDLKFVYEHAHLPDKLEIEAKEAA